MPPSSKRYQELDALRGIAAMIVVLFHYTLAAEVWMNELKYGITGVDLFFIISGFVITLSISQVSSGKEFIINRISRLYPTYWTVVSFTFVLICLRHFYMATGMNWLNYFGNLTMFQFYLGIPDLDGTYWTMIVELLFYIFILILYQTQLLKYINLIGTILCLANIFMVQFFWNADIEKIFLAIPLLQHFPLFFAGILFYKILHQEKRIGLHYVLVLLCFISQILLYQYTGRARIYITQNEYITILLLYFGLFVLFVNNLLQIICIQPFLFLGKISYSLYLVHYYLMTRYLTPYFYTYLGWNQWVVLLLVVLPICIFVATVIHHYIENPYNKKLRNYLGVAFFNK